MCAPQSLDSVVSEVPVQAHHREEARGQLLLLACSVVLTLLRHSCASGEPRRKRLAMVSAVLLETIQPPLHSNLELLFVSRNTACPTYWSSLTARNGFSASGDKKVGSISGVSSAASTPAGSVPGTPAGAQLHLQLQRCCQAIAAQLLAANSRSICHSFCTASLAF